MEAKNQPVATREEEQISGGNDSKGDELHFNKKKLAKEGYSSVAAGGPDQAGNQPQ